MTAISSTTATSARLATPVAASIPAKLARATAGATRAGAATAPAGPSRLAVLAGSLSTTAWESARPTHEKRASTGAVTVGDTTTTMAGMKVSIQKGGSYTFKAAWSSRTSGRASAGLSLVDGTGKLIKGSVKNELTLSRDESMKLAGGEYTIALTLSPPKGGWGYLTGYTLQATQDLSRLPALSGNTDLDAVVSGGTAWWHDEGAVAIPGSASITPTVKGLSGAATTLYYDFLGGSESYLSTEDKSGFAILDAGQREAVVGALDYLSSLVNVTFVQDTEKAQIAFGTNQQTESAGYARLPLGNGANPSVLMLDNRDQFGFATSTAAQLKDRSSYAWYTLIHELGHSMGLKHPGNYNAGGGTTPGPYLPAARDHRGTTVMSYKDAPGSLALSVNGSDMGYSYGYKSITPTTYKILDIAALQYMYGANTNAAAQELKVGDSYKDYAALWAPQGVRLDASATTRTNVFDLRPGAYSSIAVQTSSDQIASLKTQFVNKGVSEARSLTYATTLVNNTKALKGRLFDGRNTLGLAWGSRLTEVAGGAASDRFYAGTYSTAVAGGAGNDTLYLQGSAKDWLRSRAGDGADVFTSKANGAVITARGIEAVSYYAATATAV